MCVHESWVGHYQLHRIVCRHMLAVMLVAELHRSSWKELLVEGSCTPPHKLRAAVEAIEHKGAKDVIADLIRLADGA